MNETHRPLDEEELRKLRKTLRASYFIAGIIGVMSVFLLHLFFIVGNFNISIIYAEVTGVVLLAGIIGLTRFLNRNLITDIDRGLKIVREYIIENKESFEDNDPGLGGWKTKYYFLTGSRKFFVEKKLYEKAEVGDILAEHLAPRSQEELKIEVRKK
jgi:hypothetical protein